VEQFHAFKALEDPAHRWLVGGFVDVIGNGLLALLQALAQSLFGQTRDEQTELHDEPEGDQTTWLLHTHRGSQEQRIFQETKASFHLTSNILLERGVDFYDMKVYTSDEGRVYEQFAVAPGGTIHIDVYSNGGESTGLSADFKVTDQAVEVVNQSREIEATVSSDSSE